MTVEATAGPAQRDAPPTPPGKGRRMLPRLRLPLLLALVLAATAVGLVIGGGRYTPPAAGITDAGALVGWLLPLVRAVALAASVAAFGWLLYAAFLGTQKGGELLGDSALADVRRAGTAAAIWALASLVSAVLALARERGRAEDPVVRQRLAEVYSNEQIQKWMGWRTQTAVMTGRYELMLHGSLLKNFFTRSFTHKVGLAIDLEGAIQQVKGTARSMGIAVGS